MLLCPCYWLWLNCFVWVYLLPAWCWTDKGREGKGLFSAVTVWCVNLAGLYLCMHINASYIVYVSGFCLFNWAICSKPSLNLVLRVCLRANFTLSYTGETSIVSCLIQITCHIWPSREKKITRWFKFGRLQSCWEAKQRSHSVLKAAGPEKPSGMSGHAGCILKQTIPIRCLVSLMKLSWCVRDGAERANALRLNSALTHASARSHAHKYTEVQMVVNACASHQIHEYNSQVFRQPHTQDPNTPPVSPSCRPRICCYHSTGGPSCSQGRQQQYSYSDWLPGGHHPSAAGCDCCHSVEAVLEKDPGQGEWRAAIPVSSC